MKRPLPFIIIIAVFGSMVTVAWYWKRSATRSPLAVPQNSRSQNQSAIQPGAVPAHTLGSPDAPVMLEEFGDFQCAACGTLHSTINDMKQAFGPRVVIVFRQFPLVNLHANAMAAARAAEAAAIQNKFWQMHDVLFENQKDWRDAADPKPTFQQYAARLGLDTARFQSDMMSQAVDQRIALDRERGRWIGVNSTPTVFMNGREVALDSLSTDRLRQLINSELSAAGK